MRSGPPPIRWVLRALASSIVAVACVATGACDDPIPGYGKEQTVQLIGDGGPFMLRYEPAPDRPYQLWFDISMTYSGALDIAGPFSARSGETELGSWQLKLGESGGVVEGVAARREFNTERTGVYRATFHLIELPAAASTVTIDGEFGVGPTTDVSDRGTSSMRLIVTDGSGPP